MKFFISGGAGFIGSHMSEHLLSEGHEVKVFDNLSSGTMSHIENHLKNPHFQFTKGDIKDLNLLTDAMKGSEVVIHFAANPDIAKVAKDINTNLTRVSQMIFALEKMIELQNKSK